MHFQCRLVGPSRSLQGCLSTSPRLLNFTGHWWNLHSDADAADAAADDDAADDDAAGDDDVAADDDVAELWQRSRKLTSKTS